MIGKKILLGIIEDKDAYRMVELAYKLREIGYYADIYNTLISENYIPIACLEELSTIEDFDYDLLVIGPYKNEFSKDSIDKELQTLVDSNVKEIMYLKNLDNIELIIEKIQVVTKGNKMLEYSFLFTLGYFNEHLTNNHFIGTYSNDDLIVGLIKFLVLSGANVDVVASNNIGKIPYVEDVVYVKDINELEIVMNSKYFKYDFVIDSINIPRFGIKKGDRFTTEYQRYFAEFEENYLPFKDKDLSSDNQLIIEVINGVIDNDDSIKYLFENTGINLILLSEISQSNYMYKPFVKLINKNGDIDIITFKDNKIMYEELINEFIAKLEG